MLCYQLREQLIAHSTSALNPFFNFINLYHPAFVADEIKHLVVFADCLDQPLDAA